MTKTCREIDFDVIEDVIEYHQLLNDPGIVIDKEMSFPFSYPEGKLIYQKYRLVFDDPRITLEQAIKNYIERMPHHAVTKKDPAPHST